MSQKKHIKWSDFDRLLGIKSDKDIAVAAGCSINSVLYRRKKLVGQLYPRKKHSLPNEPDRG